MTIDSYEYAIKKYEKLLNDNGLALDREKLNVLLLEYKNILTKYRISNGLQRELMAHDLPRLLDAITKKVSVIIGRGLETYYKMQLGKDKVTISDVVGYEISKSNVPFEIIENGLYLQYIIIRVL